MNPDWMNIKVPNDIDYMRQALRLARKAYGYTSPNPMVGAVLVQNWTIIGRGWHHQAGRPHAEIEAMTDARKHGHDLTNATLYVTLEPCSTYGRTPPCTDAIVASGIRRVVVAATDPNPAHAGRAYRLLSQQGIEVVYGVLAEQSNRLNEAFNHWIVSRTPYVMLKSAMSLDGKIATKTGESRWITGPKARALGMKLRLGADVILVGIGTVLADDPSLTVRTNKGTLLRKKQLHRFILDSEARTPIQSKIVCDRLSPTTIVVTRRASLTRIQELEKYARVWIAPENESGIDLKWLMIQMGRENLASVLVEGGGAVHESFLAERCVNRIYFLFAPKIIGGKEATPSLAGKGAIHPEQYGRLEKIEYRRLGPDLMFSAQIVR